MLAQLLAKCIQLIGITQGIQDVLNKLLGKVATTAVELTPLFIQNTVIAIDQAVNIGPQSNANIQAELATFQATTALDVTAILTAIAACQQTGVAVTLPDPAPSGYGGASLGDTSDAVWGFITGFPSGTALGALAEIRYDAVGRGDAGASYPVTSFSEWSISGPFYDPRFIPDPPNNVLLLDYSTILSSDATADDWVHRVYPSANWTIPRRQTITLQGDDGFFYSMPWLNQVVFDALKGSVAPSGAIAAPVWPGLAKVTLGTSVALSDAFTITETMDGVLVAITAAPVGRGSYDYDGVKSYQNVGSLSFFSDDGDQEFQLALGFTSAVYCPRAMAHAAGVRVRTSPGLTGTCTAWTITP